MFAASAVRAAFLQTCGKHGIDSGQQRPAAAAVRPEGRRILRRIVRRCSGAVPASAAPASAAAAATGPAAAVGASEPAAPLPFFPDRRCVEELELPSLAGCHHYINLTNGIEAIPRLQQLGLPYRFLRLPSTRCEQQQFEALLNDLDADLLMRLALGQCCLVYDYGSRNKKRGAPRAVWYGLEFVRYALRRLWLGEQVPAYLRGYSVAHVFEGHVRALSDGTKKKLRYYRRYIQPGALPRLHLYGVYAATTNDGDKEMYAALLRRCEEGGSAWDSGSSSGSSPRSSSSNGISLSIGSSSERVDAEAGAELAAVGGGGAEVPATAPAAAGPDSLPTSQEQQQEQRQQQMEAAELAAAGGPRLELISEEQRHELLHGPDIHAATEALLGMRIFLGGVSHGEFHAWADRTGFQLHRSGSKGGGGRVEL